MMLSWRYDMRVCDRSNGHGCPYCRGMRVLEGYNDLASQRPDLLGFQSKDNVVLPNQITASSHKEIKWHCKKCGGDWEQSVNRQANVKGCPYCSGRRVLRGFNDLLTKYPDIAKEWSQNNTKKPDEVTSGSGLVVEWECAKCKQHYKKKISERVKYGCAFCSGHKVITGKNDLKTLYPKVAEEWDYTRNGKLRPENVSAMNTRKIWWRCKVCGKQWQAYVENRTRDNNGCPSCAAGSHTSFPEQAIYFYCKSVWPKAQNGYSDIFKTTMAIDVYIPEIRIGIEYDGQAWHRERDDVERDRRKYKTCLENNIRLVRISEDPDASTPCDYRLYSNYKTFDYDSLDSVLSKLFTYLIGEGGAVVKINTRLDERKILKLFASNMAKEKSVAALFPEVAQYWDYDKNNSLKPEMFKPTSRTRTFWKCRECGVSYERAIGDQVKGLGLCTKCCKLYQAFRLHDFGLKKNGSLADNTPYIAEQWDCQKNGDLRLTDVTSRSSKKVWWVCPKCGNSWQAVISNRTSGTCSGCPRCHGGRLKQWP